MADESASEQCINGAHYISPDNGKSYRHVGSCEDLHGPDVEDAPLPPAKAQVIQGAQSALAAAKGSPSTPSPNNAAAQAVADYFNGKVK